MYTRRESTLTAKRWSVGIVGKTRGRERERQGERERKVKTKYIYIWYEVKSSIVSLGNCPVRKKSRKVACVYRFSLLWETGQLLTTKRCAKNLS